VHLRIILAIGGGTLLDGSLDRDVARERKREQRLEPLVSELPSRRTPR